MRYVEQIPGTSLFYCLAQADDPELDMFECGTDAYAIEVAEFFRKRGWIGSRLHPDCYQFRTADAIVGYAAVTMAPCRHPDETRLTLAIYLVVMVMGIGHQFQGAVDPSAAPARYSDGVFRGLEALARAEPLSVGIYLRVREGNTRARRFYERIGFEPDQSTGGRYVDARSGEPTLILRKLFG